MKRTAVLLIAGLGCFGRASAQELQRARDPCGLPQVGVTREVITILTAPARAADREHLGLTGLVPTDLVLLSMEAGDASVCERLRAALPDGVGIEGEAATMRATMFRAGARYIVAIRSRPIVEEEPKPRGPDQTITFSLDFRPIGGLIRG